MKNETILYLVSTDSRIKVNYKSLIYKLSERFLEQKRNVYISCVALF